MNTHTLGDIKIPANGSVEYADILRLMRSVPPNHDERNRIVFEAWLADMARILVKVNRP